MTLFACIFGISNIQAADLYIESISIAGNKRTKDRIILREISLKPGDTVPLEQLNLILEKDKERVLNTGLFSTVKMNISKWDDNGHVQVEVNVKEAASVWPVPVFELADRNFNVWWSEYKHSFDRINFGLHLYMVNLSGRRDLLKLVAQYGFTQKYELEYTLPSINKKQTIGLTGNIFYSRNKEIGYNTVNNKLLFERSDDKYLLHRIRLSGGIMYRPGLNVYQDFKIEYYRNKVDEIVVSELNPQYLLDGRNKQSYFSLLYKFTIDKRDFRPYPTSGNYASFAFRKDGLGLFGDKNTLDVTTTLAQYIKFTPKWSAGFVLNSKIAVLRNQQAYYDNKALGYLHSFIRGYEFYVIDGLDFGVLKSSLQFELFNKVINLKHYMPLKPYRTVPFKVYLSINSDLGYANNQHYGNSNDFSNQLLWGGGLGLNIVAYNDKIIQIEYSLNQELESGLFLHYRITF